MKSEVSRDGSAKKQTNKSSRGNQHIYIVHPYTCLLSTSLAVLVNGSKHITKSDEKSKCRDVLYICADYPYYSCLFAF